MLLISSCRVIAEKFNHSSKQIFAMQSNLQKSRLVVHSTAADLRLLPRFCGKLVGPGALPSRAEALDCCMSLLLLCFCFLFSVPATERIKND